MVKLNKIPKIEEIVFFDNSVNNTTFFERTYDIRRVNKIDSNLINGMINIQKNLSSLLSFDNTFTISNFECNYKRFLEIISRKLEYYRKDMGNILKGRKNYDVPEQFYLYKELVSIVNQNLEKMPERIYKIKNNYLLEAFVYQINSLSNKSDKLMYLSKTNKTFVATTMSYCEENKITPALVSKNINILKLVKAIKEKGFCNFKFYCTKQGSYKLY